MGAVRAQGPVPDGATVRTPRADVWSPGEASYYASLEIELFSSHNVAGGFDSWKGATVGSVMLVRDATGDPVLYDVAIESSGRQVGLVQIWAKKSMGVPFHTVSTSTLLLDLREREAEARQLVQYMPSGRSILSLWNP